MTTRQFIYLAVRTPDVIWCFMKKTRHLRSKGIRDVRGTVRWWLNLMAAIEVANKAIDPEGWWTDYYLSQETRSA